MSTMEKDRVSSNEVDSDDNVSSEEPPKQMQRRSKKKKSKSSRRSKQAGPLDQLPLGGDAVNNTLGGVTNTLGGVTNNAVDQQKGDGGKSDTLRLRLDLNLDIEIQLKARIHGDLELALLYVNNPPHLPSSPPRARPLRFPSLLLAVSYLASTLQHRINWRLIACLPIQELRRSSLSCASVYCGRPEQGGLVPAWALGVWGMNMGLGTSMNIFQINHCAISHRAKVLDAIATPRSTSGRSPNKGRRAVVGSPLALAVISMQAALRWVMAARLTPE
ncbi:hypothetical protein AUP68_05253 [Ilyonectria robusta]